MTRSLHCLVMGKVQGVGYRAWVKDIADKKGINGWVRNLSDGRVEVLAQGDEKVLEEFKEYLTRGPVTSQVEDIKCDHIDYDKEYSYFELRI